MLTILDQVLDQKTVSEIVAQLRSAPSPWVSGRATAGHQGAAVKNNLQLAENSEMANALGSPVMASLQRHPEFMSAALPHRVYPPMFNRYDAGMAFGEHIDGAVRRVGPSGEHMRTDLSATVFLSHLDEYDGGELIIDQGPNRSSVKLPAGSMVLYPAGTIHHIEPVTRGSRLAVVFWIQSMIRDHALRDELYALDQAIRLLKAELSDTKLLLTLTNHYHNLLRRWAEI